MNHELSPYYLKVQCQECTEREEALKTELAATRDIARQLANELRDAWGELGISWNNPNPALVAYDIASKEWK